MLAWLGVVEGVSTVFGRGLGSTTLAGAKFGTTLFNAEVDISNMFYSLGLLGGAIYVAIVVEALRGVAAVWRRRRGPEDLALLAVVASTFLSWLLGGEYAIAALVWFSIGAIDRAHVEVRAERRRSSYDRMMGYRKHGPDAGLATTRFGPRVHPTPGIV